MIGTSVTSVTGRDRPVMTDTWIRPVKILKKHQIQSRAAVKCAWREVFSFKNSGVSDER